MLEIDLKFFIATIIIFLGLIAFLNAKLYKPLLAFMDEREANIKKDEEMAKRNFDEIGENEKKIEAILNQARDEASKIKDLALQEVKSKTDKEINDKRLLLENNFEKYKTELQEEKEELKSALSLKIPEFKSSLQENLSRI